MATTARIALRYPDGSFRAILVEYDGYPSHTGRTLAEWYNSQVKIFSLINNGMATFIARYTSEDEMMNDDRDGVAILYRSFSQLDLPGQSQWQTETLKEFCKQPPRSRQPRLVCCFEHRDLGEPYQNEEFDNLLDLLEAKGKPLAQHTYYHDGTRWWAYYRYGIHGPVTLAEYEDMMQKYYGDE